MANISRFEHALGVATLAGKLQFFSTLSKYDRLLLQSSALLHDWAITAFGHLVEEAYAYAGAKFEHEGKLNELVMGDNYAEVGG
ncbi:HD domain-containing protein, partial [Acinetobacter baumannii]|nr:HD domain-containing protein [Acinetobacter baumannii]